MFVKIFADGGLMAVVFISGVVGLYWLLKTKPNLKVLFPYVLMAGLTSVLTDKLLSMIYAQERRPFVEEGLAAGASYINNPGFPSDHALLATVVVMAVFVLTPYKKLSYFLILLTLLMCVARVLALVHTPLDIVGGIAAGLLGALWYRKHKQDTKAVS